MKIRKNLYLISGGSYGILGNAYIVKHKDGYIMFDCSNSGELNSIRENLHYWDIGEDEISHVFMTHGHDDHAGCAAYFQKKGAQICVGDADAYMMEAGDFGPDSPYTNHVMPVCRPDVLLKEDDVLEIGDLKIEICTFPGHTDGSVLYFLELDGDMALFSGDSFFVEGEKGDQVSTGWKGDLSYNAEKLGESFQKLWRMGKKVDIVLGGHGSPRIGNGAEETIKLAYKYYLLNNR